MYLNKIITKSQKKNRVKKNNYTKEENVLYLSLRQQG